MATQEKRNKTNPNGANQYLADPRQALFLAYYIDPKSESFGNATQSGLRAGFERTYAENLKNKMPYWLSRKVEDFKSNRLLEKAERNLEEIMDLPSKIQAMGAFGPIYTKEGKGKKAKKVPIMVYSSGLLKVKNDASKFVAEKIGRGKYAKEEPGTPPLGTVTNYTQIIINAPNGTKNTGDKSDTQTIPSLGSSE